MPPFVKDVGDAFRISVAFGEVLGEIARGRSDCGRPLAAETARQKAREVLDKHGFSWPSQEKK